MNFAQILKEIAHKFNGLIDLSQISSIVLSDAKQAQAISFFTDVTTLLSKNVPWKNYHPNSISSHSIQSEQLSTMSLEEFERYSANYAIDLRKSNAHRARFIYFFSENDLPVIYLARIIQPLRTNPCKVRFFRVRGSNTVSSSQVSPFFSKNGLFSINNAETKVCSDMELAYVVLWAASNSFKKSISISTLQKLAKLIEKKDTRKRLDTIIKKLNDYVLVEMVELSKAHKTRGKRRVRGIRITSQGEIWLTGLSMTNIEAQEILEEFREELIEQMTYKRTVLQVEDCPLFTNYVYSLKRKHIISVEDILKSLHGHHMFCPFAWIDLKPTGVEKILTDYDIGSPLKSLLHYRFRLSKTEFNSKGAGTTLLYEAPEYVEEKASGATYVQPANIPVEQCKYRISMQGKERYYPFCKLISLPELNELIEQSKIKQSILKI